jgi:hypothetical protein
LYPDASAKILGEHPYSICLEGDGAGKVTGLSVTFANLGDIDDYIQNLRDAASGRLNSSEQTQVVVAVRNDIQQEATRMTAKLSALLGPYTLTTYGPDPKTAEAVERWDWNGQAIMLAAERDKYLALRVIPAAAANLRVPKQVDDAALRKRLAARVVHRDNGDVIIGDIPMVNQGPKGYCVPATWVRDLSYMGVPADLYQLALIGSTNVGGGTSVNQLAYAVGNLVRAYGYRMVTRSTSMQIQNFSDTIDQGVPLMWAMFVVDPLNADLTKRSVARKAVQTPADLMQYVGMLDAARQDATHLKIDRGNGHMCMIIGYNKETNELAISDSWGPSYAERWITVEEAQAITQGMFWEISW